MIIINLILFSINFAYDDAKFEPPDGRVIHGLGQYVSYFYSDQENWQLVYEYQNTLNTIPLVYSVYAYVDPLIVQMDSTDFIDIVSNHGYPYVLLIGLTLFDASYLITGAANIPVQRLLNGDFDQQIVDLSERIKNINAPVFLRPGFEFGTNNRGIHNDPDVGPEDFKNIWYHIYNIFLQKNVTNVAWVWNTVNPQLFNYIEWYPGDDYVDWWGINYFTPEQMNLSSGFLNDASFHQKPVIICESCPNQNGGTTNASNWEVWFIPYFNLIKNNNNIKLFIYISDPWDKPGFFSSWPDSRINSNETIRMNYEREMQDTTIIHMNEYLNNPYIINDTIIPPPVQNFSVLSGDEEIHLNWENPGNPDFAGVRILRKTKSYPQNKDDGRIIYVGLDTIFRDLNLQNDTTYYYAAFSFDRVGNFSKGAFIYGIPKSLVNLKNLEIKNTIRNLDLKNYPNPFNSVTTFSIDLKERCYVNLDIFNINGQKVETVFSGIQETGVNNILWDASNYASGIYFALVFTRKWDLTNIDPQISKNSECIKLIFLK